MYPSAVAGSKSTHVCDYCFYDASGVGLAVGAFYLGGDVAAENMGASIGCRLQKLP